MQPLDRRDRGWALALTLLSAAVVLVLAVRIHQGGGRGIFWLDAEGQRVANGHLFGFPLVPVRRAQLVVSLGDTWVFATLMGAVVVIALILRDRLCVVVALVATPLALLATEVIGKPLVGRREGHSNAFPSGHTAAVATLVALVALMAYRRGRVRGLLVVAPMAALVPAMGLALVRINLHLFSDTVAGALIGGGTVLGLAWLVSVLFVARSARGTSGGPQSTPASTSVADRSGTSATSHGAAQGYRSMTDLG